MTDALVAQALAAASRILRTPGELAVRCLFFLLVLVIFSALWGAAVAAHGGELAGYDHRALVWYVVAAEASVIATKPRMIESIGQAISSGAIVTEMLRPVPVVALRLAGELGESAVRFTVVLASGIPVAWLLAGGPPEARSALLALPAALLGVACNLAAQHAFAASAFWLADARAAWFLYQKVVFLAGGMLLPLEFLPHGLAAAARVLPFAAMAYAPARLASGHFEPALLAIQAGWLAALVATAAAAFLLGERRVQAVGG